MDAEQIYEGIKILRERAWTDWEINKKLQFEDSELNLRNGAGELTPPRFVPEVDSRAKQFNDVIKSLKSEQKPELIKSLVLNKRTASLLSTTQVPMWEIKYTADKSGGPKSLINWKGMRDLADHIKQGMFALDLDFEEGADPKFPLDKFVLEPVSLKTVKSTSFSRFFKMSGVPAGLEVATFQPRASCSAPSFFKLEPNSFINVFNPKMKKLIKVSANSILVKATSFYDLKKDDHFITY